MKLGGALVCAVGVNNFQWRRVKGGRAREVGGIYTSSSRGSPIVESHQHVFPLSSKHMMQLVQAEDDDEPYRRAEKR